MIEPDKRARRRTRVFLVIFFGIAVLFGVLNIYATLTADPVRPTPATTTPAS